MIAAALLFVLLLLAVAIPLFAVVTAVQCSRVGGGVSTAIVVLVGAAPIRR